MSDYARFCPKCYAFFRDPDLYATHVATCGTAQKKDAEAVKELKKMAVRGSLEKEVRSKEVEEGKKQVRVKNETSDSCLLSSKSLPTIYLFGVK